VDRRARCAGVERMCGSTAGVACVEEAFAGRRVEIKIGMTKRCESRRVQEMGSLARCAERRAEI
jgi:hypothetical protein